MSNPERIRRAAQEIANTVLADMEYCLVCEDDELQDLSEAEHFAIYSLANRAKAALPHE